jgi:hypothetical protein
MPKRSQCLHEGDSKKMEEPWKNPDKNMSLIGMENAKAKECHMINSPEKVSNDLLH